MYMYLELSPEVAPRLIGNMWGRSCRRSRTANNEWAFSDSNRKAFLKCTAIKIAPTCSFAATAAVTYIMLVPGA